MLFDVEEAKRTSARWERMEREGEREREREREDTRTRKRERERDIGTRYQVPIPSRHHAGITVPGCLIGFNRNRQSSAAEFRKETTVLSSCSSSSIYERPLFVRPWVPIDPMAPWPCRFVRRCVHYRRPVSNKVTTVSSPLSSHLIALFHVTRFVQRFHPHCPFIF